MNATRALGRYPDAVGLKVSLTSSDAQQRVGCSRPIWGWLTKSMNVTNGSVITATQASTARAEAELVFVLGEDLKGPGVTGHDVLSATSALCPGIELPTRFPAGRPPTVDDLIARNAMATGFVLGAAVSSWRHLDLALLGVVMEVNGEPIASGTPAAVLGHPAEAIASVVNDLAELDEGYLTAGQFIFSGGITPAVALRPGMTVDVNFAHLGRASVSVAAADPDVREG
jgi:2-oxo-3-hexenedioate decarboxylase